MWAIRWEIADRKCNVTPCLLFIPPFPVPTNPDWNNPELALLLNPTGLDPAGVSCSGVCEPHVQPPLQENSTPSPFLESTSEGLFSMTTVSAWSMARRSKLARFTSCGVLWLQLPPSLCSPTFLSASLAPFSAVARRLRPEQTELPAEVPTVTRSRVNNETIFQNGDTLKRRNVLILPRAWHKSQPHISMDLGGHP